MKPASGVRRALVGATWLGATTYLSYILNFGLNVLLARLLFPKEFGQFALAASLAELLSIATGFSFSQGIIQMADAPGVAETAYVLSLRLYGALLLVAGGLAVGLSHHYPGTFIPLFFALVAVRNLSLVSYIYSALMEKGFLYNPLSVVRLVSVVVSVVAAVGLARLGAGVWSLLGREVALSVATLIGVWIASGWRYRGGYNARTAGMLWRFGWKMFVMRALETIWYRGDTALLGILAGTLTLGFYDRARYLAEFGHYMVSFAAVQVSFPLYARLQARKDALTYAYGISHGLLIRLMLPFAVWLALFPHELVELIYGAGTRWTETMTILPWLAIFGLLFPVVDNIKVLLTGIGRLGDAVWVRLVQVLVALPLLVPAIYIGGARGAAAVMVVSEAGGLAFGYWVLRRRVTGLYLGSYLRPIAAATLAGGMVVAGRGLHVLPWAGRLGDAANLGAVAGLYLVSLFIMDRQQLQDHLWALIGGFRGEMPSRLAEAPTNRPSPAMLDAAIDGKREQPAPAISDDLP